MTSSLSVSIVGLGAMGRGLLYQALLTPGIRPVAVAELHIEKASAFLRSLGLDFRLVRTEAALLEAVEAGVLALAEDADLVARCPAVHAMIEATSSIIPGLRYSRAAIASGQHVVLMNAEVDLAFGPLLLREARRQGVTVTSCDGDQHGVIARLVQDMRLWGFELVLAGNVKGFLDRYSNPTKIIPEADKRNLDYRMCTAYTDGSKLNVEMALLANALGLRTDVPGMHGPRAAHVNDSLRLFDLEALRAVGTAAVDYVLGSQPDGGVFAIGHHDHPFQRDLMRYYKMGPGPYYVFYRPYHLCHVEAMQCVLDAAAGRPLLQPSAGFRTNVFARAKKPLAAGDHLDGIGGFAAYGLIENCPAEGLPEGLPLCLAEDVRLRRAVEADEPILLEDVDWPAEREDFAAYLQCYQAVQPAQVR